MYRSCIGSVLSSIGWAVDACVTSLLLRRFARQSAAAFLTMPLAILVAACSMSVAPNQLMIDPSHYLGYHCKDFVNRLKELQTKQKDLSNLMDKAGEGGASGTMIGNLSYRSDYENAISEEQLLRRTAADRKCDLPPPPAAAPPPSAATVPVFQSDQIIH